MMRHSDAPAPHAARGDTRHGSGVRETLVFVLLFGAIYGILHLAYYLIPDSFLRDVIYHQYIVSVAAWFLNTFTDETGVRASANMLLSHNANLEIVRGCDGIGLAMLVLAGIVASPVPWRRKFSGMLLSLLLVYVLNEVRIVGLYYVVAYQRDWFDPVHTFFAPTLLVLIFFAFYAWWALRDVPR